MIDKDIQNALDFAKDGEGSNLSSQQAMMILAQAYRQKVEEIKTLKIQLSDITDKAQAIICHNAPIHVIGWYELKSVLPECKGNK